VKAAPFRYERPRDLKQALELLRSDDAKAIAGGQSLVPMMAMRLARPRVLVDLGAIAGLDAIEERDGELVTGAMVRQRALERHPGIAQRLPLVAAALPFVGHREIRSRGTVGGSLAHADPAAELGLVAATLRATIVAQGSDGIREIAGDELVRGPFQTALGSGELLTAVRWPASQPGDGFAFAEVARRHGDFALCGVAVHVRRHEGQTVLARVGLLGVGPAPIVHELTGSLGGDGDPAEVAAEIAGGIEPPSDMHAGAGYRRRLVRVLVERCIHRALDDSESRD
jgi:2-furoyl-CoA dehydrogenase FAD binding subunit